MIMKKQSNLLFMAALIGGMSVGFISCSDDDDKNGGADITPIVLTIDDDLKTHGIEVGVESEIVEVPINCDGGWTALLDDTEWVTLEGLDLVFTGNQTLRLRFDENRTGADRTASLRIITDYGDESVIPIRQNQKFRGEDVGNDNAQWFGNNGLGRGYNFVYMFELDPEEKHKQVFNPNVMCKSNPIFNWAKISELQQKKVLSKDAYVENTLQVINFDDIMQDSLVVGTDTLHASLDVNVGFGFMEFEAHGAYNALEYKGRAKLNYLISRTATVYDAFVSEVELATVADEIGGRSSVDEEEFDKQTAKIMKDEENYKKANLRKYQSMQRQGKSVPEEKLTGEYLEDWQANAINAQYDRLGMPDYGGIFSTSFARLYYKINYYVTSGQFDKADKAIEQLDEEYGPLFVERGWFGGSIHMRCDVDTAYFDKEGHLEASLKADICNVFNIEGAFSYGEKAAQILKKSDLKLRVFGGDALTCGNELAGHFNGDNMGDRNELISILQKWGNSLTQTEVKDGKAIPTGPIMQRCQLLGIWNIWTDEDAQAYIKDWMRNKHPRLKSYEGIIIEGNQD